MQREPFSAIQYNRRMVPLPSPSFRSAATLTSGLYRIGNDNVGLALRGRTLRFDYQRIARSVAIDRHPSRRRRPTTSTQFSAGFRVAPVNTQNVGLHVRPRRPGKTIHARRSDRAHSGRFPANGALPFPSARRSFSTTRAISGAAGADHLADHPLPIRSGAATEPQGRASAPSPRAPSP